MKIGWCGLGKLGLPCAVTAAMKGHDVIGYDIDPAQMSYEPRGYQEAGPFGVGEFNNWLAACDPRGSRPGIGIEIKGSLRFGSLEQICRETEIIFVSVQTPHQPRFEGVTKLPEDREDFSYSFLISVCKELAAQGPKHENMPRTVVIVSTVLPRTMRRHILPLFKHTPYVVAYNPSFIAMSTTMRDYLDPEFVLIGVEPGDEWSQNALYQYYRELISPAVPIRLMSIESAELSKVGYNCAISSKIAIANTMLEICHKIPEADVDDVCSAMMAAHRRITSSAYMRGGMGDGGCLDETQQIYTEHGLRSIADIAVGDLVLADDGRLHPVITLFDRHFEGDLIEIKAVGLPPVRLTPNHRVFTAQAGSGKRKIRDEVSGVRALPAGDLAPSDYVLFPSSVDVIDPPERDDMGEIFKKEDYSYHRITSISRIPFAGRVFNVEVEDANTYVTTGGAVHNSCHPRDNIAMSWLARDLNLSHDLFSDIMQCRDDQARWIATIMHSHCIRKGLEPGIYGFAYKPDTNITTGSPALLVADFLRELGHDALFATPPMQPDRPRAWLVGCKHKNIELTRWPAGSVVIDPFRCVADQDNIEIVRLGQGTR